MLWPLPSVAKNASLPSADALLWDTGSFAQRRFPPPPTVFIPLQADLLDQKRGQVFRPFFHQLTWVMQKISLFKSK